MTYGGPPVMVSRPQAGIETASAFTMQNRHTAGQTFNRWKQRRTLS